MRGGWADAAVVALLVLAALVAWVTFTSALVVLIRAL